MVHIEETPVRDWHAELGLRRIVNAAATLTSLGGSLMPPEVVEAMAAGARQWVDYPALQAAVGGRIAEMTHNEACYISSGAAAGITLSVAACMTGMDRELVLRFPDADAFERNEVLVFGCQRNGYDYAATMTGATMIDLPSSIDALRERLSERTAAVLWFAGTRLKGDSPELAEIVAVAHEAGVPVIVDAAAQIPPVANLWHFTRDVGADIAIFSGGKGLRGPQSSGLVLGRRAIIDAIAINASPNYSIGRPMKVGKEELFGILAAVEWTLAQDEPAMIARYEEIVRDWLEGLQGLPGVEFTRVYPSEAGQNHGRVIGQVLPGSRMSRDEIQAALWDRDPRIAIFPEGDDLFTLNPQVIGDGEVELVVEAVREVLQGNRP
jgi:uncharacterized pyridoxal phosphate-dependent enzyme